MDLDLGGSEKVRGRKWAPFCFFSYSRYAGSIAQVDDR